MTFPIAAHAGAEREHGFWRTRDHQKVLAAYFVGCRMIFELVVERNFRHERRLAHQIIFLETDLFSKYSDRRFGRITRNAPTALSFGVRHPSVRAERRHFACQKEFWMIGGVDYRAVEFD